MPHLLLHRNNFFSAIALYSLPHCWLLLCHKALRRSCFSSSMFDGFRGVRKSLIKFTKNWIDVIRKKRKVTMLKNKIDSPFLKSKAPAVKWNMDEAHSSPDLHAAARPGLAEECATLVDLAHLLAARDQELRTMYAEMNQVQSELRLARSLIAERDSEIQRVRMTNNQYVEENERLGAILGEWSTRAAKLERTLEAERMSNIELQ